MTLQKLQEAVQLGWLSLVFTSKMPRSGSHAFIISFSDADGLDLYYNNPFSRKPLNFEQSLEAIYTKAEELRTSKAGDKVRMFVSDAAQRLTAEEWSQLQTISSGSVFIMRNPLLQFESLIERVANDSLAFGSDKLPAEACWAKAEEVDVLLKNGADFGSITMEPNYGRASWKPLSEHLAQSVADVQPAAIIEGTLASNYPEIVLQQTAQRFMLGYNPNMLDNWTKQKFFDPNAHKTKENELTAYTKRANESKEWRASTRSPKPLSAFPKNMQTYIADTALPLYQTWLMESSAIYPRDREDVKRMFDPEQSSILHLDPVLSYALANAFQSKATTLPDDIKKAVGSAKQYLKETHTEFADVYGIMDATILKNQQQKNTIIAAYANTKPSTDLPAFQ